MVATKRIPDPLLDPVDPEYDASLYAPIAPPEPVTRDEVKKMARERLPAEKPSYMTDRDWDIARWSFSQNEDERKSLNGTARALYEKYESEREFEAPLSRQRISQLQFKVARQIVFPDLLVLPEYMQTTLLFAGYTDREKIMHASDADLLDIRGIAAASLAVIRQSFRD